MHRPPRSIIGFKACRSKMRPTTLLSYRTRDESIPPDLIIGGPFLL